MFPLRKILVPSDFSPSAVAALDCAVELASKFDAEILLLHVLPTVAQFAPFPVVVPLPSEWVKSVHEQAQAQLVKEASRIGKVKVSTEVREAPIHESVLATAAGWKADLIVMGTHGRRGLSHVLLGSVAERVLRGSVVPVLTVRARS